MEVSGRKHLRNTGDEPSKDPQFQESATVIPFETLQYIERTYSCHDKSPGDDCSGHVVRILKPCPWIHHESPETGHYKDSIRQEPVGHRMLHPCIANDDKKAGDPGAEKYKKSRSPVTEF